MHQSIALPNIEIINIEPSSFSPLISKCHIKVCYVSDEPNRNRSVITKDVAREMAFSLRGAPIVGYYNDNKGDFEEHNRLIDISNGKFEIKDTTKPYGFVDLNAKCWFQEFDDEGTVHEYLMTEGWIWTSQYPESQRILDEGNNQSMELDEKLIDAHWAKDNNGKPQFFIINEAIISKLCILGEDCEPCFEGAQITKVQFSLDEGFKESLFSMIKEITQILKEEGGTPVFTTYAVEIGESLWNSLFEYLVANYPEKECEYCSMYRIEGIYEEGSQKFAILQHRGKSAYFRMNFSYTEEGFSAEALTEVEKEFIPVEAQFAPEAVEAFELEYASKKKPAEEEEDKEDEEEEEEICEKCGKPVSECTCEDEEDDEEKKKGKKAQYVLEEIPEYMELSEKVSALNEENEALKNQLSTLEADKSNLETQLNELVEFKKTIERKEKETMINETFYMLTNEEKKDVIDNIDTYSLDDIEAKLSIYCVRNKISFNSNEETTPTGATTFSLDGMGSAEDAIPAWAKAVLETQKTM